VFALQLKRSPNDNLLKNNLALTLLLLGRDLPAAHQLALESHTQSAGDSINSSTYAFSLLLQGKPAESRKVMETLGPNVLKVPNIAAYYAIITAATGDKKTARQYLEFSQRADLLPEEKALLDGVRKSL
jgi:Flp pilus assembly protein TadD